MCSLITQSEILIKGHTVVEHVGAIYWSLSCRQQFCFYRIGWEIRLKKVFHFSIWHDLEKTSMFDYRCEAMIVMDPKQNLNFWRIMLVFKKFCWWGKQKQIFKCLILMTEGMLIDENCAELLWLYDCWKRASLDAAKFIFWRQSNEFISFLLINILSSMLNLYIHSTVHSQEHTF